MPTYQYRCTQCGNELEVVQKFSDPALTECAECHGALRKVYNAVGVVFKGSGFYRTDSRAAEGKKTSTGDSAPAKTSESGSTGSKEGSSSGGSSAEKSSSTSAEKKPASASSSTAA